MSSSPPKEQHLSSSSSNGGYLPTVGGNTPTKPDYSHSGLRGILPRPVEKVFHFRRYRRRRLFTPILLVGIFLGVLAICLLTTLTYRDSTAKSRGSSGDLPDDAVDIVQMYGRVTQVDLPNGQVAVTWSISAYTATPDSTLFFPDRFESLPEGETFYSNYPDYPIDIYMNENCTASAQDHDNSSVITGYNPKIRNFGYDPLAYSFYQAKGGGLGFQQTFSVNIPFDLDDLLFTKSSTDLIYPFDKYKTATVFCAVRSDTNQTYPLFTTLGASPTNFVIDADDFAQNASYASAPVNNRQFLMTIQRTTAVKAFAGCIFLANWSIALVVVWMAFLTLIWRKEFAESLIVVPITALFSMPAVRSVAPGIPPFGSLYDLAGFLPQIIFVALCSAFILFRVLQGKEHTWIIKEDGPRFAEEHASHHSD